MAQRERCIAVTAQARRRWRCVRRQKMSSMCPPTVNQLGIGSGFIV